VVVGRVDESISFAFAHSIVDQEVWNISLVTRLARNIVTGQTVGIVIVARLTVVVHRVHIVAGWALAKSSIDRVSEVAISAGGAKGGVTSGASRVQIVTDFTEVVSRVDEVSWWTVAFSGHGRVVDVGQTTGQTIIVVAGQTFGVIRGAILTVGIDIIDVVT
jgi:hypothetical protein